MKTALIKLHLAVFLWGFTGILGKFIDLNEIVLVWFRVAITLLSFFIILKYNKNHEKLDRKIIKKLFFGGFLIALHWIFFYASIKYSSVSIALICLSTIAFFTAFLEPIINKVKFSFVSFVLSCLAIIGISIIFKFDDKQRIGIAIGLISAFLSSLFSCYNKKQSLVASSQVIIFYQLSGGLLLLTFLLPFYVNHFQVQKLIPNQKDWLGLIMLSWFCTVLAMWLSLDALKKVSAFTQNLTLNLEPVYGIALAFLFYNEQKLLGNSFYIGMFLICVSVVFQTIRMIKYKVL